MNIVQLCSSYFGHDIDKEDGKITKALIKNEIERGQSRKNKNNEQVLTAVRL